MMGLITYSKVQYPFVGYLTVHVSLQLDIASAIRVRVGVYGIYILMWHALQ